MVMKVRFFSETHRQGKEDKAKKKKNKPISTGRELKSSREAVFSELSWKCKTSRQSILGKKTQIHFHHSLAILYSLGK